MSCRDLTPGNWYLGALFDGLFHVLRAAQQCGGSRVSIASTAGVYDGLRQVPWREDDRLPVAPGHAIPVVKVPHQAGSASGFIPPQTATALLHQGLRPGRS